MVGLYGPLWWLARRAHCDWPHMPITVVDCGPVMAAGINDPSVVFDLTGWLLLMMVGPYIAWLVKNLNMTLRSLKVAYIVVIIKNIKKKKKKKKDDYHSTGSTRQLALTAHCARSALSRFWIHNHAKSSFVQVAPWPRICAWERWWWATPSSTDCGGLSGNRASAQILGSKMSLCHSRASVGQQSPSWSSGCLAGWKSASPTWPFSWWGAMILHSRSYKCGMWLIGWSV